LDQKLIRAVRAAVRERFPTASELVGDKMQFMRPTFIVSLFALTVVAPCRASAQVLQSFEDLALRINLGDELRVEDQLGVRTRGRLIRLSGDGIWIQTDLGEKHFTSDAVRGVARRGHSLPKGALIGAAVVAVLGAVATCSHEDGANCVIVGALRAAPVGVGAGMAVGALIPRMETVYRALESRAPVPALRAAPGVQTSLLEDLALRVNLDDELRVEDRSGVRTTGRLTRLTADEITIRTDGGEKRFTRETLRQVAVRRRPLRMAVLVGAGVGAVAGAAAACTGPDREECADAPILAGALGAGLGLAVGALLYRTTIVYPDTPKRTLVLPMISRDAAGVRVSLQW
jgi:hypothetical protein